MAVPGSIRSITDFKLTSKRVFIRVDFNVPLSAVDEDGERHIEDDSRIVEALPTIKYAIEQGARIVLASHLGRPDGERKMEFSLEPAARRLATLLGQEVTLTDDCLGDGIELMIQSLKNGQVLLLENLRFRPEEEANDPGFARDLSQLADIYINDAFGTAHRKHASTYGVPSVMPQRGMGLLIQKELKYLDPLLQGGRSPFYAILGGSKVSDKIATIESLLRRVNGLVIGGAMGNAFWVAQGKSLPSGARIPKTEEVAAAKQVLKLASERELPVVLPVDTVGGFDIGPATVEHFKRFLEKAKVIFWNGPLGWFERDDYAVGTVELAKFVAGLDAVKIVGGGDTVSAIKKAGVAERFDHLSTGGGAVLEYLEGNGLPGLDILKQTARQAELAARSQLDTHS